MARRRRRGAKKKSGGISRRLALGLMAAASAVGLGAVLGTGAVERINSIRGSDVGVASDDNALLGVNEKDPTGTDGDTVTLATLTNNFDVTLDTFDVSVISSGDISLSNIVTPGSIDPDQTGDITADIGCTETVTENVELKISGRGSGLESTVVRTVSVKCEVDLDPLECEDVWDLTCDYNEGSSLQLDNGTRDGSVCMDNNGDVSVQLQTGSTIESFLRITSGDNADIQLQEDSIIKGAVAIKACSDVNSVQLQGSSEDTGSEIKGDLCIRAGGSVDIQLQQTSIIGRDLKIDADGDISVSIEGNSEVKGTIDKSWNSGWTNNYC